MKDLPGDIDFKEIMIVDDKQTPFPVVVEMLESIFARSSLDADKIAREAHKKGAASCGKYPVDVARLLLDKARSFLDGRGHALPVVFYEDMQAGKSSVRQCSFCGKMAEAEQFFDGSDHSFICSDCLLDGAKHLSGRVKSRNFSYTYELLSWHFCNIAMDKIVTSERTFPLRMQPDLQRAVDVLLTPGTIRMVGVHFGRDYDRLSVSGLLERHEYHSRKVGPLQYEDVDIGEDCPVACLKNGLWLRKEVDLPYAVLCAPYKDFRGGGGISLEIAVPPGSEGQELVQALFRKIEKTVQESQSYRGKVLSLEQDDRYEGTCGGIKVHKLSGIDRSALILPEATIEAIDRNIIRFAKQRPELKRLGQSTKKGLLFHGAPGDREDPYHKISGRCPQGSYHLHNYRWTDGTFERIFHPGEAAPTGAHGH